MNNDKVTTQQLMEALGTITTKLSFLDRLKVKYRPIICPFDELLNRIQPGKIVADIGCGSGQLLWLISKFRKPSKVLGVEISERLVGNATQLFSEFLPDQNASFKLYNGVIIPDFVEQADYILLIDVWHHVPVNSRSSFFESLSRTMKPGASLIFKDIDAASHFVYINKLHDLVFASEIGNEISLENAEALMLQHNLEIIEVVKKRTYVYPHYTVVARKPGL